MMDPIMSLKSTNSPPVWTLDFNLSLTHIWWEDKQQKALRWYEMQHKRCTLEMSDSFVSLWYSNHSGPSSLEACQNVPSLYWLQCLNTGIYTLFSGAFTAHKQRDCGGKIGGRQWNTENHEWWNRQKGKKTKKQIIQTSHAAGVITQSGPCVCSNVCACISTCVSV